MGVSVWLLAGVSPCVDVGETEGAVFLTCFPGCLGGGLPLENYQLAKMVSRWSRPEGTRSNPLADSRSHSKQIAPSAPTVATVTLTVVPSYLVGVAFTLLLCKKPAFSKQLRMICGFTSLQDPLANKIAFTRLAALSALRASFRRCSITYY